MIDCPNCKSKRNTSGLVVVNNRIFVDCFNCGYREEYKSTLMITCPNCKHDVIYVNDRCPNCGHIDGEEVIIPNEEIPFTCPKCNKNTSVPYNATKFRCSCGFECNLFPELYAASNQETFASGAVRANDNTPTYTLIPACALRRLAKIYETGNIRYPDNQWRKGIPVSNIVDHALEHLMKWLEGSRTEDHLAKVAWAMFSLMYYESVDKLEDDVKWAASSKH